MDGLGFKPRTIYSQLAVSSPSYITAVQSRLVQYSAVQWSAVQCIALHCSAVQCNAVQCSAVCRPGGDISVLSEQWAAWGAEEREGMEEHKELSLSTSASQTKPCCTNGVKNVQKTKLPKQNNIKPDGVSPWVSDPIRCNSTNMQNLPKLCHNLWTYDAI